MDVIHYTTWATGVMLYSTLAAAVQFVPAASRPKAQYAIEAMSVGASFFFARLLPPLEVRDADLTGKTAVVTGANSGIGLWLAKSLVARNATVYLACRSRSKAEVARDTIFAEYASAKSQSRVHLLDLDTADLASARACAAAFRAATDQHIDFLIHNAGIATVPAPQKGTTRSDAKTTPNDAEILYRTNFLSSFLLTNLLEDRLSPTARVIFTASHAQYAGRFSPDFATQSEPGVVEAGFHQPPGPDGRSRALTGKAHTEGAYANSKAMQCAFARLLQARFNARASIRGSLRAEQQGRVAHAFTPGFTRTPILRKFETGPSSSTTKTVESSSWYGSLKQWYAHNKHQAAGQNPGFAFLIWSEAIIATEVSQGAATGLYLCVADDEKIVGSGLQKQTGVESCFPKDRYWDRLHSTGCTADWVPDETLRRLWARWEADAGVKWSLEGE